MCQRIEVEALDEASRLLLIQVSKWKESVTGAGDGCRIDF